VACLLGLGVESAMSDAPSDHVPDTDPWPWVAQTWVQTWTTWPMLIVLVPAAVLRVLSYRDRRALQAR